LGPSDFVRYTRLLKVWGRETQRDLSKKTALVVGVGGLGTNTSHLLARAGVNLILVDYDIIEEKNLQHQTLYAKKDIGKAKAEVAGGALSAINPQIKISTYNRKFNPKDVKGADIVLDCTDNMETRFKMNETCVSEGIPWVYASCVKDRGMLMFVKAGGKPCLSCLLPSHPKTSLLPDTCTEGTLPSTPAFASSIQVTEALKYLTGVGKPTEGLIYFSLFKLGVEVLPVKPDPSCKVCF
jgi:molybdopterin/thiamine biosynthesis adenylyltransferase